MSKKGNSMDRVREIFFYKLNTKETLYFGFFILLSVTKGLGLYEEQKLFILLAVPALICGFLKVILSSYTKRQWITVLILLLITAIVYYQSLEPGILFIMLMILGMKDISSEKVFRVGLWVWTLCSVFLCVISFFRIEHTVYRVSDKLGLGYIMRWSLGFTHPNTFHITYLALCAYIIHELADRYEFKHFILLMIGNVLVFFYSVSFTGFGIVTVFLVGELYVAFRPRFNLLEKILVNMVLPIIIFASFVLPLLLHVPGYSEVLQKLNALVNTRINVASNYLVPECMSLFGVRMSYLSQIQSYLSIDSSYIWAFIHYGIVPFALFMLAYFILIADYTGKQKTRELVMIICFLAAGITEPLLFNTSFKNVTLLFLGELLFRQKDGEREYYLIPVLTQKTDELYSAMFTKVRKWIQLVENLPSLFGAVWTSHRRRVMAGIAVGALLGVILCGICYTQPKGYIVPRRNTDWREKISVYLTSAEDPVYEGYRIMNYRDAETPMQIVEGNAVVLETVRYYVGSILIGGLAGYLTGVVTIMLIYNRGSHEE
ncbi:MAG: hypothetical protein J1F18_00530 [Lachnospiraceae bacterium]|nr:hypothetical protein [Lachnospiraceae bacterium]